MTARAQAVTPIDDSEKTRFDAVARALETGGYTAVVPVGHGEGATDRLFAFTAVRGGKGALLVALEPSGSTPLSVVEVESDATPADLGVRGIRFGLFLGEPSLYDVVVAHMPFRLEVTYTFERHHVLRQRGTTLAPACDYGGDTMSSYSKGIRSVVSRRTVTVEREAGGGRLRFDVKAVDETSESQNAGTPGPASTTERAASATRYELSDSGVCVVLSPPPAKE
jgi:hypothetical protein